MHGRGTEHALCHESMPLDTLTVAQSVLFRRAVTVVVVVIGLEKCSGTVCVLQNGSEMTSLIFQSLDYSLPRPLGFHSFSSLLTELVTSI